MSFVSSYMFITYESDIIKRIEEKLSELSKYKIELKEANLNESGPKMCQFRDIFCFAGNYFDDDTFQNWIYDQKFNKEDIQIFFNGENDEYMQEL